MTMTEYQKRFFSLPDEEFEKELDKIMKESSGSKYGLCGKDILNKDEISYPDSPECCKAHGVIDLCPEHQEWFFKNEKWIDQRCIRECYKVSKMVC